MKPAVHNRPVQRRKIHRAVDVARAAVVLVVAAGTFGCATPDPRTPDQRASDQAIASQIHSALLADSNVYSSHINVDVKGGVVWLTGWVTSAEESQAAVGDISAVPGVRRVVDQVELMDWMVHW
jgi:osmotically-inducible protein OsmY